MEIKLGGKRKGIALVSEEDYELLSKYSWSKNKKGYVTATINGKSVRMHKFIMNADKYEKVDHINRKKYDNRRENLRIINTDDNNKNKGINKNSNKYKFVFFQKIYQKYSVRVTYNSKTIYLGWYDDEIEAAEIADMYIVHNDLDYVPLNFPDKKMII